LFKILYSTVKKMGLDRNYQVHYHFFLVSFHMSLVLATAVAEAASAASATAPSLASTSSTAATVVPAVPAVPVVFL
jgi:hypothetical protein